MYKKGKACGLIGFLVVVVGVLLWVPSQHIHLTFEEQFPSLSRQPRSRPVVEYPALYRSLIHKADGDGNMVTFTRYSDVHCAGGSILESGLKEDFALRSCALHKGCQAVSCYKLDCRVLSPSCILMPDEFGKAFVIVDRTPKQVDLYSILLSKLSTEEALKKNRRYIVSEFGVNNFTFDNTGVKWKKTNVKLGSRSDLPFIQVTKRDHANFGLACVDPIHKIVFFRTPKVLSSNLLRLYDRLVGHTDIIYDKKGKILMHSIDVANDPRRQRLCFKYIPINVVNLIMNDPSFRKVVFFRDPLQRLLSCYLDKFMRQGYASFFNQSKTSFTEFIEYVNKAGPPPYGVGPGVNYHYQAQMLVSHIFRFLPLFDFIGWGDNFNARLMLERYGLWEAYGAKTWPDGFMKSGDHHATDAKKHYDWWYNSTKIIERAKKAYAIDYHFFKQIGLREDGPPVNGYGISPYASICGEAGCAPAEPVW